MMTGMLQSLVSPSQDPQEAMKQAQKDAEVYEILTNDLMRSYRIDIETDSTIAEDAQLEKQSRIELVTAITAFMEKVGPMVQAQVIPTNVATELLGFAVRGFKVGRTLEDTLDEMSQSDDDPKAQQIQQQFQMAQQQMQAQMQEQVEGIKQQAGKEIEQRDGKIFDLEKKIAINSAADQAKLASDKYKADLQMMVDVFRADLKQSQEETAARMRTVERVVTEFSQMMQSPASEG
jgi:hypothetical protein